MMVLLLFYGNYKYLGIIKNIKINIKNMKKVYFINTFRCILDAYVWDIDSMEK